MVEKKIADEMENLRLELVKALCEFAIEVLKDKTTSTARVEILPEVVKALFGTRWC